MIHSYEIFSDSFDNNELKCVIFTGNVLIHHILRIFKEYGLTESEVKKNVIFLSDRGPNLRYGLT